MGAMAAVFFFIVLRVKFIVAIFVMLVNLFSGSIA